MAVNLRVLMASLPPLAETIREDLSLTAGQTGLLTTIPVLCMGLLAPASTMAARRFGTAQTIGAGVTMVLVGTALRGIGGQAVWSLYAGTLAAGIGIALAGTLLPGIVKTFFPPERAGLGTGLTMFAMMGGAGVAAAVSVPLARALGGWPPALLVWVVPALVGVLGWVPIALAVRHHTLTEPTPVVLTHALPWRSVTAWLLSLYLSFQSWQFYSSLAWLAPTYESHGWAPQRAGLLMALFTGAQLVSGLVAPALFDRVADPRVLVIGSGLTGVAGEIGVWLLPDAAPWLWALLLGAGQGAAFALGLTFLVRYAATPADSARLTALAFLISYSAAALGPATMGWIKDTAGTFTMVWGVLALLMVPQLVLGSRLRADRPVVGVRPAE